MKLSLFFFVIFFYSPELFGNDKVAITAKPTWIQPVKPYNNKPNAKEIEDGYYESLHEQQIHVELKTTYIHEIRVMVSDAGVQNGSEISVSFNPAYQNIQFHQLIIRRNGQEINKLKTARFRVIQDENDLNDFIYNGTKTAFVALEDVRKGDQIEFAYSIIGRNPIFGDRFFSSLYFHVNAPVSHHYKSLLYNSQRPLHFKSFNTPPKERKTSKNGLVVIEWEQFDLKEHKFEEFEPEWYENFPNVEISEFIHWKEVIDWAKNMYEVPRQFSPSLQNKINEWKKTSQNDKYKYLQLAVRFVQDEIRYMGFEIGPNSHRPTAPDKVFSQRFGDCKDKSLLLSALLKANDIKAYPALVNSYFAGKIDQSLPSPFAFNHVIVRIELFKSTYWVDPTTSYQRGNVSTQFIPYYDKALVIKDGENGLQDIPRVYPGSIEITESYHLSNIGDSVTLDVKSNYSLNFADNIRNMLYTRSIADLEKSYHEYYSKIYAHTQLDTLKSLNWEDNVKDNRITVNESYVIKNMWERPDSSRKTDEITFWGQILDEQLRTLPNKPRKTPIAISYPYELDYSVVVHVPKDWSVVPSETKMNRDSYEFEFSEEYRDKVLTLHYHYKAKKGFIPANQAGEYIADVKKMKECLGQTLTWNGDIAEKEDSKDSGLIIIGLVSFLIFSWFGYQLYKFSFPVTADTSFPINIGGWLILVGIGIVISPIRLLINLFDIEYFNASLFASIDSLTSGTTNIAWKGLIIFEIISNIFLIVSSLILCLLFFNKRNTFPKAYILFLSASLTISVVDFIWAYQFASYSPEDNTLSIEIVSLIRMVITCAIWIPYFLTSERVKETFTFPYSKSFISIHSQPPQKDSDLPTTEHES